MDQDAATPDSDAAAPALTSDGGAGDAAGQSSPDAGPMSTPADGGAPTDAGAPGDGAIPADSGPAAGAVPTADLLLWLRADQGISVEAGAVARWSDLSGAHADAVQSAASLRPSYRAPAPGVLASVAFDGVDDFLALSAGFRDFSKGLSIFMVVRYEAVPMELYAPVFEASNGIEIDDISAGRFERNQMLEVIEDYPHSMPLVPSVTQAISIVQRDDKSVAFRKDGVDFGQGTASLPRTVERSQCFVGKTLYTGSVAFNGTLHELLVYARALSPAETQGVELALKQRWQTP
jgi:hypothetical protein